MTAPVATDISYHRLVEEAAFQLSSFGMVDMETAAQADELGYSTRTLTTDAEQLLADTSNY
jgi:hypothetical protein